jgi:hypothetical protein
MPHIECSVDSSVKAMQQKGVNLDQNRPAPLQKDHFDGNEDGMY